MTQRCTNLGKGSALAHNDLVANLEIAEGRRHVDAHHFVALLKAVVLSDKVEVVPSDSAGPDWKAEGREGGERAREDERGEGKTTW